MAEWIQKQDLYICCLQEIHFRSKDTQKLKVKGWEKLSHANGNQKQARAVLISDKIDFFLIKSTALLKDERKAPLPAPAP